MKDRITVTFKAWDLGCLCGVLESRIREVEQHMRVCEDRYTPEARVHTETFLAQMRGSHAAITTARAAWLSGKRNE